MFAAIIAGVIAGAVVGVSVTLNILDRDLTTIDPQIPHIERDLAGVPKMPRSVAGEHRKNRYENLHTIEQILALPTNFAQTEALYVLAGRSNSGSVQNLIYEANRIADALDRSGALDVLFFRLTELDPQSAIAMARMAPFSTDKDVESAVWRAWGKLDLDASLSAAKASPPGQRNIAAQALYSAFGFLGNETTARIEDELGIRPDRSVRARYLYSLADRSPADAIDYVSNIQSSRDQRDSLSWLAHYLSRNDPERAAAYADLFADANLRETYRYIVASTTAAAEPQVVLNQMLLGYETRQERMRVYGAMRELVSRDLDSAMQFFERVTSPQDRQEFGSMIAEQLARQDPARALAWARDTQRGENPMLLLQVLQRIALSDPQLAMEEAKNIPHAARRSDAISNVVRTLARNDPLLAAEFVKQIADPQQRQSAASSVVRKWARKDPDAAIDWVMSHDENESKAILSRMGSILMMTDMDTAISLLPKLDAESAANWRRQIAQYLAAESSAADAQKFVMQFEGSEDYSKLQAAVASGVAQNDIYLAKQLADQLPAGTDKDTAYVQLVSEHANTNPTEAAAWLASISSEQQRISATSRLVRTWYAQDPDAAGRWAENLPRGAQRDDAIVSLASHWQDMTPSRRLLIESIGNAEKQNQARIARIQIAARTDWQKAQKMLRETHMSGRERQQVQRVIDHYRDR